MTIQVFDPATLEPIGHVPDQGRAEAADAVHGAAAAHPAWAQTAPRARSEILRRTYELMMKDRARLAALISTENGKARADAEAEVGYAADFFRWYAEEAVRPHGEYGEAPSGDARTLVSHRPVGVAALVTPWNFPAAMVTRKVAPALAAGCTAVLKPAAETPLTALAIAELLAAAGLPDDVVRIVTTTDAGAVVGTWLEDHRVRKLSFTGSTGVGRLLLRQAADRVINTSMELGGNAPFIVTADADLDAAVEGAMTAKFRGSGQACTAANRFFVHADVHDAFVGALCQRVRDLRVGAASDGADLGPLISAAAAQRVEGMVSAAEAGGARIAFRSEPTVLPGHFVAPVVLTHVAATSPLACTEIFGPVAPIIRWSNETTLLKQVNDTEYGLAAYVFSRDLRHAIRLAEAINAGMVGINRGVVSDPSAPFGGVKQSGVGREGARDGLRAFQEPQYLSVGWP